jgi:hypothetical protein
MSTMLWCIILLDLDTRADIESVPLGPSGAPVLTNESSNPKYRQKITADLLGGDDF